MKKDIKQTVDAILSRMTIKEKVAETMQVAYTQMSKEQAEAYARMGVGSFLHVLGEDARHLQDLATTSGNGIPLLFGIDAIHGHCLKKNATIFPTQLSMACSFDPALIEAMASATAREVAADGLHLTFSPVLCLGRDTRWGRVAETFGEDKHLAGVLGAAMIRGYQGDDPSREGKILACAKHFIGYGESTGGRDSYDTEITERKMRAEFLPPFEKAVEAGCASVMTAYGSLDGVPCTANKWLLSDILKGELGFDGFVITDWDNIDLMISCQHVAEDYKSSAELALNAGNDMMMKTEAYLDAAVRLVEEGRVKEAVLDAAVRRILTAKMRLGLFDDPYKRLDESEIGAEAHRELSRTLAKESVVLLKNDGVLPLEKGSAPKRILVVGANADAVRDMYGDWTYFSHPDPNFDTPPVRPYVTFLEGMRACALANDTEIVYVDGCGVSENDGAALERGFAMAKNCDLVVYTFGDSIFETGEGKDRADLSLPRAQAEVFERVVALGLPIVSVMIASKPLCVPEVVEKSRAFLTGFNLGAYGGEALAETIFGCNTPSGKLPISFPYHVGQLPAYYNYLPGWHRPSYVDMPKEPLFTFGEGLSYTTFAYRDVSFDKETLTLSFTVENTGTRAGKETAQVYMRDPVSSVMTPVKQLVAFEKVTLEVGEHKKCKVKLTNKDFSLVLPNGKRVVEAGKFVLMVGGSAKDEALTAVDFHWEKTVTLS